MDNATTLIEVPPEQPQAVPFAVVGIGASAGGLKALQRFVEAIPADGGMAYVVIMHLDPDRESRIAELLQDRAAIAVTQVTGPQDIEANHIYVIPPDRDLEMVGSSIATRPRGERSERAPVDLFFRTLSEACGSDSVGVVLSGTGTDGTLGIRSIRQAGGITVAQSLSEAEYEGMPSSAIASGLIDVVLPSSRIPAELLRLWRGHAAEANRPAADAKDTDALLAQVFAVLRDRTGHDFRMYKRSTVLRRLDRRLLFTGAGGLEDYLALLQSSAAECASLLGDLLISVSAFFRDPEAFEALAGMVPALFEGKGSADTVRVWVVGCATGEEVYSVGMVLVEHAATLSDPPGIQMFATDIDEKGYAWGREGLYPAAALARVGPERLRKFFTKDAGGYRVSKALRGLVLFAIHNVLRDPPFARMDLISCRNLFIYLKPEAQEHVLHTFHYALRPHGRLFLGTAESAGNSGLFVAEDAADQPIFLRNGTPHRVLPRLSAADPQPPSAGTGIEPAGRNGDGAQNAFSYAGLHVRMLEQYGPPSAVVNEQLEVVHISAGAGRFLRLGEGELTRGIMDLTHNDLRMALRTALHQAFEKGQPTTRHVWMDVDGVQQPVDVHVRLGGVRKGARFALIIFEARTSKAERTDAAPRSRRAPDRQDVAELGRELDRMREQLESTSAAHDRTVAELQTVNEELRSLIEEEKAAREELETGREENQSINEELTTINQEHQSSIEELKRTNADLHNLIESTEIGTIFLDRAMRIRRFTPGAADLFNLLATDHGRPLGHITHRLDYPGLNDDIARVLASLERIEREVANDVGESFIVRINPYRSMDGGMDGVVLTFFDNTAQHRVQQELQEAKTLADAANMAKSAFLSTMSHEFRTPLNAIMGYADIMEIGQPLTADQQTKVDRIKAGGRHLVAMIDELLEFARLDSGNSVPTYRAVDGRSIAAEAHALMVVAAESNGLTISLHLPEKAVPLETDVNKVRQILVNLCGNAIKFTPPGGEIGMRVAGHSDQVVFEISDTGIGIAASHHALIFERFWQVDGGATRAGGGMGIGLAAARAYGLLLGGDIEVESELGKGSTFRLRLPAAAERR